VLGTGAVMLAAVKKKHDNQFVLPTALLAHWTNMQSPHCRATGLFSRSQAVARSAACTPLSYTQSSRQLAMLETALPC
jgi:hypothetical protein